MKTLKPYLIDTTLRDGEQTPGVVFNTTEKLRIAQLLDAIGIPEVEVGSPAMGKQEIEDIKAILRGGFHFRSFAWCRATEKDLKATSDASLEAVSISFPVSDIHLNAMGKDKRWVIDTIKKIVPVAKHSFSFVGVGFQDATRCEFDFLYQCISCALEFGVQRIRIADTVGILHPLKTAELFRRLKQLYPSTEFEFHGHNDFGMATANTLVALQCGATSASVTVNGIGERAGNAALEEILLAYLLSENIESPYNTSLLSELSSIVSKASSLPVHPLKPIIGCNVFRHESGTHIHLLQKDKLAFQPFAAPLIGKDEEYFVIGKHSGRHAISSLCTKNQLYLNENDLVLLTESIKLKAQREKRALTNEEVLSLAQSFLHSRNTVRTSY